jgi:N-acetylglucosaminyl-diphospho-decaprenol L-rhamnosyltransferase
MQSGMTADDGPPWVRVIIVNYNAGPLLQPCLDAVTAQSMGDFEVVVVDNASTDGSLDAIKLPDARFTLVRNGTNIGFAAANNIGAQGARTPWLATLNPDTVAAPDWLEEMRRGAERHQVCMLGATLLDAVDPSIVDGFGDVLTIAGIPWRGGQGRNVDALPLHDAEVFSPCAAAALYARASFERAGGFDEAFFCYLEDVDLGFRLRLAGERCVQLRRAIVRHHGSAITGAVSDFTLFHSYRNRVWLIFKNMPASLLLVAVPLNVACSLLLILILGRRGNPMLAPLKGLASGLWPGPVLASRREVQRQRRISTAAVARALVWDIYKIRRLPVVTMETGAAGDGIGKTLDRENASQ